MMMMMSTAGFHLGFSSREDKHSNGQIEGGGGEDYIVVFLEFFYTRFVGEGIL